MQSTKPNLDAFIINVQNAFNTEEQQIILTEFRNFVQNYDGLIFDDNDINLIIILNFLDDSRIIQNCVKQLVKKEGKEQGYLDKLQALKDTYFDICFSHIKFNNLSYNLPDDEAKIYNFNEAEPKLSSQPMDSMSQIMETIRLKSRQDNRPWQQYLQRDKQYYQNLQELFNRKNNLDNTDDKYDDINFKMDLL